MGRRNSSSKSHELDPQNLFPSISVLLSCRTKTQDIASSLSSNCLHGLGKATRKPREFNACGENLLKSGTEISEDLAGEYISLLPPTGLTKAVQFHMAFLEGIFHDRQPAVCFSSFSPQFLYPANPLPGTAPLDKTLAHNLFLMPCFPENT